MNPPPLPTPSPAPKRPNELARGGFALIAAIVLFAAIGSSGGNNNTGSSSDKPTAVAETKPPVSPCKADWTKCADNSDMANKYDGWHSAQYDCKETAIKLAKYGTPEFPWLLYFSTFLKGNDYAAKGIAVLYEDGAKFQNGFGAMAHAEVRCEYDLRAKKVIDVTISTR
jgi:hypothetical protein